MFPRVDEIRCLVGYVVPPRYLAPLACPPRAVSSTGRCNATLIKWDVAMKRRTRINYIPEQKAIIWDRYKQGDSSAGLTSP